MKKYLLLMFILIIIKVDAQQFGANPNKLQWKQIDTDSIRIIFPSTIEDVAIRVASVAHAIQNSNTSTIGNKHKKISIVLQNQATISNAYVGLGPYRSEFYLMPPQNPFELGTLPWADNLTIHEYRHVEQYNNFNTGLSKVAGLLFGQQGRALANAAAIPDWFFEGDAVYNETALSMQGRGRLPDFFKGYIALYQNKKNYNYAKLRNGSLKDFVPTHYQLGYLLVHYGREKYGVNFWKNVTQDAAQYKPLIYPFQHALKKYSGISYNRFVKDALAYYHNKWDIETKNDLRYLTTTDKNNVTDYQYPYTDSIGNIIALKTSYRTIPAFYKIDTTGKEEKIAIRDIAYDDYFSFNNGLIVYSAYKADIRYGYKEYSNIKVLNIENRQIKKLTVKGRFFSPDISHDGSKVVAVEMKPNQECAIVIMDLNGKILQQTKGEKGIVYSHPKFATNDNSIYVFTRNEKGQMALKNIDVITLNETTLIAYSNNIFGLPTIKGDTIYFTSTYNGSDEAWAYIINNKSVYRVAKNVRGLYHPTPLLNNNKIIASNFTTDGFRLAVIEDNYMLWEKVNGKENALPILYSDRFTNNINQYGIQNIQTGKFNISKYNKSFQLINFHSWRPTYSDPEISFTFLSENILNTLKSEVFYTYNRNETSHTSGFNALYGGWFIQPLIGANKTFNRVVNYNADTSFIYNETNVNTGLRIPLNFSANKHFTHVVLNTTVNYQQIEWRDVAKQILQNQKFYYLQNKLSFTNQIQQARQQIFPRWAQQLTIQHRTSIDKTIAHQVLLTGALFLPGLMQTHNIVFTAAYQGRDTMRQFSFANNFPFSRGYTGLNYPRMWKFGCNYHFPLLYPDWGFGNIVYCRRIRANGFYDASTIKSLRTGNSLSLKTIGTELFFDTRWWNQQNVTFGIRYSHLLDAHLIRTKANQWEIILPVNLF